MKQNWTEEQRLAIETKNCSLLVAAAAGSGKTAVLVERIIKRITDPKDPVDIDKLLIVTFTNAAASEMRERISDALALQLENQPDSLMLQRQMALLGKASIMTLHSFCLDVIRNNFHLTDLDPNFRIADETESIMLKSEALAEVFENHYQQEDNEVFLKLVESYSSNKDDKQLQELVLNIYEFVKSSPWPEKWLNGMSEKFNVDIDEEFSTTLWGNFLLKNIGMQLESCISKTNDAINICKNAYGLDNYEATLKEDIYLLRSISQLAEKGWDELHSAFTSCKFSTLKRCIKDADEYPQERVKKIRDSVKKTVNSISSMDISMTSAEIMKSLKELYPILKCLSELVMELDAIYSKNKKEKLIVDFNDLEHFCLSILIEDMENLKPSMAALSLREKFEEILVDEYQDSNYVQELIINMISGEGQGRPNIFMVGDVKQSIYRFRQARPELFMDKYTRYVKLPDNTKSLYNKILLFKNFRSRKEVIHAVNMVFYQLMSKDIGELDYDSAEALNPGAEFPEPDIEQSYPVELHIYDMEQDKQENTPFDSEYEEEEELDKTQLEARIVGRRIQKLLGLDGSKPLLVYDKKLQSYRNARYSDIVILMRSTANTADIFVEELMNMDIPSYSDSGTGLFKTTEINVILSMLSVIDNPRQDIHLLTVLRSPVFNFNPDQLAKIRIINKSSDFYQAVTEYIEKGEDRELVSKTEKFINSLQEWRKLAKYTSTDELIWYLYNITGYYSYVGALPGGIQRQANLRMLFEKARQFESTSYKGLFNFINFINKFKSGSGDFGSAKILGENDNVVRVMSIHKSKGLEFPIVFISNTGKKFNLRDMNGKVLVHQDLGYGPDFVDIERRLTFPSAAKQAIRVKMKMESLSEELRVLYVAMTRAKEKLIITGVSKSLGNMLDSLSGALNYDNALKYPAYMVMERDSFLSWIIMSVIRHPDASVLRQKLGMTLSNYVLADDKSRWELFIYNNNEFLKNKPAVYEELKSDNIIDANTDLAEIDEEIQMKVKSRLGWSYKYKWASSMPAKLSVSELKRRQLDDNDEYNQPAFISTDSLKKPAFMEGERGLTAAEKGTTMHFVMQNIDLKKEYSEEDIRILLQDMIKKDKLTEIQAKSVDIKKIYSFLRSSFVKRIKASLNVFKEIPFNLEVPCDEVYGKESGTCFENDTILVQGIIDCWFEEPDGLVLLDYKTDRYITGSEGEIIEKYRVQLNYYKRALQTLTGKAVKESYLYMFHTGKFIFVD